MGSPFTMPDGQPQITEEMIDQELAGIKRQIDSNTVISAGLWSIQKALGQLCEPLLAFVPEGDLRKHARLLVLGIEDLCRGAALRQDLNLDLLAAHREQFEALRSQLSSNIVVPRTVVRRQ